MINENPLVSIIIPVYNGERYLWPCIRSVICQDYINIEIIIVNDGSCDGSLSIINQCKESDIRIKCVDKQHEGLVLARVAGLSAATGKYIQHLDADDTLLSDAISRLVHKAEETKADIIAAPFYFCYKDKAKSLSVIEQFDELTGIEYYERILIERAYWSVWSHFCKREFITTYFTCVVPEISYGEDAILMIQLILNAKKVVLLSDPILNYNRYDISMTSKMNKSKFAQLRACEKWTDTYLENKRLKERYGFGLAQRQIRIAFISLYWQPFEDTEQDLNRMIRNLDIYPELITLLTKRQKMIIRCYRFSQLLTRILIVCNKLRYRIKAV